MAIAQNTPQTDKTLGYHIYRELEGKILHGEWLPGTKVSLRTLASSLKTSMQPVREALSRLVSASVLQITPSRTFQVPPLDRATADEIWSMRLLLEGEAAARFARRATDKNTSTIVAANDAYKGFRFGELGPTMRASNAWNRDLVLGSASPILIEMALQLLLRYAPFHAYAISRPEPHDEDFLQFTLHIQQELVTAIRAGDVAAARHLRCADLRSYQRYLYGRIGWDPEERRQRPSSPPVPQGNGRRRDG